MKAIRILLIFSTSLFLNCHQSDSSEKWNDIFDKHDIYGTFVLKQISTQELSFYNKARSEQQFVPASTFKILNSLIALQTSVIKSVDDTIKWDGIERDFKSWNRDQTMRSAISVSCVWFYQELARRIGKKQMLNYIEKADYGNQKIENQIDRFWLDGNLKISAKEQIAFIEKLIKNKLPFEKQIQEIVKEILITDKSDKYTIHSKTGWSKQIAWNVGYIETDKDTWIFALNIEMEKIEKAKYRKIISYEILEAEGIIK